MNFRYVAYRGNDKKLVKGIVAGSSEAAAAQLLLTRGYRPITVKPASTLPAFDELFPSLFKVKEKDVIMFSRQLATLLESGISIVPALQLIQGEMSNRLFKRVAGEILTDLRGGTPFSEALSRHKGIFDELYCQMVAVGERTGGVSDFLKQAATYMEKNAAIKKKIKKALTYPIIVLCVALVVITVLMVLVLPKLTDMLIAMNVNLPLTTRMLIGLTNFVTGHLVFLFGGTALAVVAALLWVKQPSGRYVLHQILLRAPVMGKANLMGEMARFSRTLSLLIHAGLSLPDILEMTRKTSSNVVVRNALASVRTGLLQGEGLSEPMSRNPLFPRLLVQMVMVGEESGRLDSTLETVANSYEAEADDKVSGMVSMIEPAMTIALGLIIAFIALSVITPMYSMTGSF